MLIRQAGVKPAMRLGDLAKKKRPNLHFLICGSCFWCASLIGNRSVKECPLCRGGTLESIPLASGEKYLLEYSEKRGMLMDFA
jgi:hypothetical protein